MTDRNKERELHAKGTENIFSAIIAEISSNPGKEDKRHVEHQTGRTRKKLPCYSYNSKFGEQRKGI